MAELAESEPEYRVWTMNKEFSRDSVVAFGFTKFGNLGVPSSERYPVSGWQNLILGTNKPYFFLLWTKTGITAGYNDWT